jgi:hypothetical protein
MSYQSFIYEYQNPNIKKRYDKQQEHNNKYAKYHFRNTFEIYNYADELWEVYNPTLINYTYSSINDYDIKNNCYYILKYKTVPKIKSLPKLIELKSFLLKTIIDEKKTEYIEYKDRYEEDYNLKLGTIIMNYLKNGNYYETTINDYIKDNQIKIRPIKNTTGYTFGYNPSMIKNNYWVQKDSIEVIEDINNTNDIIIIDAEC